MKIRWAIALYCTALVFGALEIVLFLGYLHLSFLFAASVAWIPVIGFRTDPVKLARFLIAGTIGCGAWVWFRFFGGTDPVVWFLPQKWVHVYAVVQIDLCGFVGMIWMTVLLLLIPRILRERVKRVQARDHSA